jgi:hypothetical protein
LAMLLTLALPGHAQEDTTVSRVNGDPIAREDFHARARFVRWQYLKELETLYDATGGNLILTPDYVKDLVNNLEDSYLLGDAVLAQMEEERLLWQTGEEVGATPTAEDVQEIEAAFFSLWTDVTPENLPESEDAQAFIAGWYAGATAASGLSEDDIHALFANEALRDTLLDHLANNLPTEELSVHSRHILCSFHPDNLTDLTPPSPEQRAAAETCIETALARLENGDSFATVAQELSGDRFSASQGGDLGWVNVSYLMWGYAEAVSDAELNTLIGPVETELGLHLIEVLDRRMQPLTQEEFEASQQGYFQLWLDTLWDGATVERSDDWDADLPTEPGLDTLAPEILAAIDSLNNDEE